MHHSGDVNEFFAEPSIIPFVHFLVLIEHGGLLLGLRFVQQVPQSDYLVLLAIVRYKLAYSYNVGLVSDVFIHHTLNKEHLWQKSDISH